MVAAGFSLRLHRRDARATNFRDDSRWFCSKLLTRNAKLFKTLAGA